MRQAVTTTERFAVLASYPSIWEAEIVVGRLQAAEIDAQLRDQHIVSANWLYSNAVGGVKVVVPHEQLVVAQSLLESPVEDTEESLADWGACENCGSTETELVANRRSVWLSYLLLGFPLFLPKHRIRCRGCGTSSRVVSQE